MSRLFRLPAPALALLLVLPLPAAAQKKAPQKGTKPAAAREAPPQPAIVTVGQVNDRRGSFARLAIGLELPDVDSSDVAASRVVVTRATDDTGRDLVPDDAKEKKLEPSQRGGFGGADGKKSPALVTVELKNPARKATVVKEAAGEIELYMPGKDPNGVADVPGFLAAAGKPVSHPALAASGVGVTVLTKAAFEAEKKRLAEQKRQEAKKEGLGAEMLESVVTSFLELFFTPGEDDVLLKLSDPKGRVQEFAFVDPAGEEKRVGSYERDGITVLSAWGEKAGPDWTLRVKLKTPKTLARYAFALKEVPLP